MTIETYSDIYREDIVRIAHNFYDEAIRKYDLGISEDSLSQTITNMTLNNPGNIFLLIVNGRCEGVLAGIEVPSLLNAKRIFQEIIWYVNPQYRRYGIKLMNSVIATLKTQGFATMIMAVLEDSKPEKIKAFYERMGFRMFETHYIRSLDE